MDRTRLENVLRHVRGLVAAEDAAAAPDGELLERFVRDRDEAAFAALVRRHGPRVLAVCRRVLRHAHDAEDACQAAFLVLARRAAAIRKRESVGSWLYGVAYRAASRLKRDTARRRAREAPAVEVARDGGAEAACREVQAVFDEELSRLPERFRAPLQLCYVDGKTRDEAARELGWSLSTLRGRLERGRQLLRARLTRRGVTLAAALLAVAPRDAAAALPAALTVRILRVATGQTATGAAARVVALAEGVVSAMWMTKVKAAAVLLAASLVTLGAGAWVAGVSLARQAQAPPAAQPGADEPPTAAAPAAAGGEREPPADPVAVARNQAQSRLNLKKLALAMHNYHDVHKQFPPAAIYAPINASGGGAPGMPGLPGGARAAPPTGAASRATGGPGGPPAKGPTPVAKGGRALLSWRVAVLPYLGEKDLYDQFKLDEPWDGPHNRKLLEKMPQVYAPPGVKTSVPYSTFYRVFVGEHAVFEKHGRPRIADLYDGTSNTLLIVEAASAVPWTKPEELPYAADEPLPELGGLFPGVFHAAFADGAVHRISKAADAEELRKAVARDDGLPLDWDRLHVPAGPREAGLKQEGARLRRELEKERAVLEALRGEAELAGGLDAGDRRQREENERLKEQIRQVREEAARLAEEVRRARAAFDDQKKGKRE